MFRSVIEQEEINNEKKYFKTNFKINGLSEINKHKVFCLVG